jgi:opacity protein-like surface antigen
LEVSMRRIALAALACAAFSAGAGQSASAADLPVKAPRVAAPIQYADWSGVYVGIEGGYGWGRQSGDSSVPFNNFRDWCFDRELGCGSPSIGDFFDFLGAVRDTDAVFPNGLIGSTKQKGWLGGGFAGVQKQWGMWVLGLEADFDAADIKGTSASSTVLTFFPPENEAERLIISHDVSVTSKIDQLGSVRGKIGFVPTPNLLLYGTGGMAFAHVHNTVTSTQTINYFDVDDLAAGDSDAVKFYSKPGFGRPISSLPVPDQYVHAHRQRRGGLRFQSIAVGRHHQGSPELPVRHPLSLAMGRIGEPHGSSRRSPGHCPGLFFVSA